jgi:hypothetical protein
MLVELPPSGYQDEENKLRLFKILKSREDASMVNLVWRSFIIYLFFFFFLMNNILSK